MVRHSVPATLLAVSVSSLLTQAAPVPVLESAISALKARRSESYDAVSSGGSSGGPSGSVTDTGGVTGTGAPGAAATIWQRPDRPKFDGTVYQFLDMGDATTYLVGGDAASGPMTLAAQATKTYDMYTGGKTAALVGDVIIADPQAGIIAEAIGVVAPSGARGELFNVIACNVEQGETAADCILVDYDGTSTKTTYSATIKGTQGPVSLGPATAVPENLSMWAKNALSISKVTVGGSEASPTPSGGVFAESNVSSNVSPSSAVSGASPSGVASGASPSVTPAVTPTGSGTNTGTGTGTGSPSPLSGGGSLAYRALPTNHLNAKQRMAWT